MLVLIRLCYRAAQRSGIWAWDSEFNEAVLVIPWVLALLGDNPMQSEFACHIGLRGKLFCRACWAKGSDSTAIDDDDEAPLHQPSRTEGDQGSDQGSDVGNDTDSRTSNESAGSPTDEAPAKKSKGRKKKVTETFSNMVNRVKSFIKVFFIERCPATGLSLILWVDWQTTH